MNVSRRPQLVVRVQSCDLSRCLSWVPLRASRNLSRTCRDGNLAQTRQTLRPYRAELSRRVAHASKDKVAHASKDKKASSRGSRPIRAVSSRTVAL